MVAHKEQYLFRFASQSNKKNRWRHSSDRLHHLNLLWNSWRRACVKARPTTWAPTIMIWAINLACREILWSPLVAQKHQEVAESQNTHHFEEKVSTYATRHVVSDILFGNLLVPRPSSGLPQLVSSPNVLWLTGETKIAWIENRFREKESDCILRATKHDHSPRRLRFSGDFAIQRRDGNENV